MKIQQLGPYRVVRKLGRGGMGTVYEGVNLETGEQAAVKILSDLLSDEEGFRERFETEIETLRKLNHPGIVRLFGFGEQDGHLFYAMELVDGISLEEELRKGRRFDWREVTQIGIEVCRALRHAHDRGIIHRDLKPGNLLLAGDGHVKLSDFGIARLFGYNRLTTIGSVLGTAEYMAPEQAEGRGVDPRSDLYSLGGVLYALLSRRPPFQAASLAEMLHMQRFTAPQPIANHAPDAPAELQAMIGQLLEKEPERRFPNAAVCGRRLEAMLQTLTATPETVVADVSAGLPPPDRLEAEPPADQAADNLPPTQPIDQPSSPAAPPPASAPAADDLPPTKPTAAFKRFESSPPPAPAGVASDKPSVPDGSGTARSAGTFTPVAEHELDQAQPDRSDHRTLISLHTWVLAAGLLLAGATIWYFLQPRSADALYAGISAHTADGSIDSLLEAEGEIEQFLVQFPKDPRSDRLRTYEREIQLHRLERKFERRAAGLLRGEDLLPIERTYLESIQYAQFNPEGGVVRLQALIDLFDHRSDTSGPTGQCLELAKRRLERLREQIGVQAAQHLALLHDRLDQADRLAQASPDRARAMRQAVIELYGEKPWAADAVRRARATLGGNKPSVSTAGKGAGGEAAARVSEPRNNPSQPVTHREQKKP